MEEKAIDLFEKINLDMQQGFKSINDRLDSIEKEIKKHGTKIDDEIINKIKGISEGQSVMREDLNDIKDKLKIHNKKLDELTMIVNTLMHKQDDQDKMIYELRRVK
ncbi:MAG: hypothetical protein QME45_12985 [Clostridiales bacterium]|nr:hypothetical protein [Clostridiales bacterium]HBM80038.1 hypothetical protein [Clostridiaceae bacterium]